MLSLGHKRITVFDANGFRIEEVITSDNGPIRTTISLHDIKIDKTTTDPLDVKQWTLLYLQWCSWQAAGRPRRRPSSPCPLVAVIKGIRCNAVTGAKGVVSGARVATHTRAIRSKITISDVRHEPDQGRDFKRDGAMVLTNQAFPIASAHLLWLRPAALVSACFT